MKKMLLVLAVLAITVPALAGVLMEGEQVGTDLKARISYDASSMSELVRAFGLNISCSDDAKIVAVTFTNGDYNIYPGSIQINAATGEVENAGNPVAVAANYPGTETLDGVGSSGMTIEMGWLDFVPENNDVLIEFTVDKACTITVTENAPRGGIVMEDPTVAAAANFPLTFAITAEAPTVCVGNVSGDDKVTTLDITKLVQLLQASKVTVHDEFFGDYDVYEILPTDDAWMPEADVSGDGKITTLDITKLVQLLQAAKVTVHDEFFGDYDVYEIPCN